MGTTKTKTKTYKRKSKSGKSKSKVDKSSKRKLTLAEKADKFDCYQKSVQSPDHEVEFFEQAYRDAFKKKPYSLREDFCGTFAVCCEWVKSNRNRKAIGVDLCADTLQWGRVHNLFELNESQAKRIELLEQDVRTSGEKVDVPDAEHGHNNR